MRQAPASPHERGQVCSRDRRRRTRLLTFEVITIRTDAVSLDRTTPRSSIAIGHGFDAATGDEVTFAADVRSMTQVTNAMARGEVIDCSIEPWQVLTREVVA
jgi:hypothetical protein